MSINAIHEELMANLESAVDIGKFMKVFGTLIGVIREQQDKIDQLNVKSDRLEKVAAAALEAANKRPPPQVIQNIVTNSGDSSAQPQPAQQSLAYLDEKLSALEDKLNGTLLELHGLGEDNSMLDRDESVPDFLAVGAFTAGPPHAPSLTGMSKKFIPISPALMEGEAEDNDYGHYESKPGSAVSSAFASKRSSIKDDSADEQATDETAAEDVEEEKQSAEETESGESNQVPEPAVVTEAQQPSEVAPAIDPSPAPTPAPEVPTEPSAVPIARAPSPARTISPSAAAVEDARISAVPARAPHVAKGITKAPSAAPISDRPSTMRESFTTRLAEIENSAFPGGGIVAPKSAAITKALWTASVAAESTEDHAKTHPHLHRRIIPHFQKYHIDAKLPHERLVALAEYRDVRSRDHRDKMDANNFNFLTAKKRHKLCRLLKQKGRFIQISRNMLEESRQKYAARSLKQNVEFVEAETRRLFNRVSQMRDSMKRQHGQLRYMLPVDFHETFDRLADLLEHLDSKGGVEELIALPRADKIISYDDQGNLPKHLVDAITARMRPVVLQELSGLKNQVQTLKEEALTHSQFMEIMQGEVAAAVNTHTARTNTALSKEKEQSRKKMIALIKECIAEEKKAEEEEEFARGPLITAGSLITTTGSAGVPSTAAHTTGAPQRTQRTSKPTPVVIVQEAVNAANKEYVDAQMAELKEHLAALQLGLDTAKDASIESLAVMDTKMEALEQANKLMLERDVEAREARRKDTEAMKIMQKRLANVSIDNVMDELKVLQSQVNDRPSTTDVSNMMEGISLTFKKHLGENVVGLRGLVDQVYRQIHHKVNREDIKKLISAKLAQMEQDILRREEEMFSAASSTRCMSCGQLPADPTNAFVNHTAARRVGSGHPSSAREANITSARGQANSVATNQRSIQIPSGTAGFLKGGSHTHTVRPNTSPNADTGAQFTSQFSINNPSLSSLEPENGAEILANTRASMSALSAPDGVLRGTGDQMDDELSLHSEHSHNNMLHQNSMTSLQSNPQQVLGPVRSEEIYSVITGSAGLKALMPQHTPMLPVRDPYGITAGHQPGGHAQQPKRRQEKVPEPMYRKAKLAAHLKEMVKVSAPSAQNYGYSANNPFFVVEGYSDEADPHAQSSLDGGNSLYSRQGTKGRPRTQGNMGNANNSMYTQQQVYVPIPRNSTQPNSVTQQLLLSASTGAIGSNEHVGVVGTVLPYISSSNKTPQQESDLLRVSTSKLNTYA